MEAGSSSCHTREVLDVPARIQNVSDAYMVAFFPVQHIVLVSQNMIYLNLNSSSKQSFEHTLFTLLSLDSGVVQL